MKAFLKENFRYFMFCITLLAIAHMAFAVGPESPNQALMRMRTVSDGIQSKGANVLQVGFANNISAAVASATITQVVAAPASGSLYLRAIWVEKMTTSTGSFTITTGTGTNCGTGTTTITSQSLAASQTPTLGEYNVNLVLAAGQALCLSTDAATTSVRALYN